MQHLTAIDDFIAYQAGGIIIKLTWTNHGAYTVTVNNGEYRHDDLGGSYPTETEARAIARGYAQMFKAEHEAKLAEELANPRTVAAEPAIARMQAQTTTTHAAADAKLCADILNTAHGMRTAHNAQTPDVSDILDGDDGYLAERRQARTNTARFATRTQVHTNELTPAELDRVRQHRNGVVTTAPGQSWTLLRAIYRRIGGTPTYKPGARHVIASLRLNTAGLALAGHQETRAA